MTMSKLVICNQQRVFVTLMWWGLREHVTLELDIKSRYAMEFSQAYLVDSSLTGVLKVRILGWIWFLLDTSS